VVISITNCYIRLTYLLTYLLNKFYKAWQPEGQMPIMLATYQSIDRLINGSIFIVLQKKIIVTQWVQAKLDKLVYKLVPIAN